MFRSIPKTIQLVTISSLPTLLSSSGPLREIQFRRLALLSYFSAMKSITTKRDPNPRTQTKIRPKSCRLCPETVKWPLNCCARLPVRSYWTISVVLRRLCSTRLSVDPCHRLIFMVNSWLKKGAVYCIH